MQENSVVCTNWITPGQEEMDEQNLHQEQDAVDYQDAGRESMWQCKFINYNSVNF
jgi:hypothetical protein